MSHILQGKIHEIFDTVVVSPKFKKREFVLEYADNPMYPQYVLLQLVQDKVDALNGYGKGDLVSVNINIRGRAWTDPKGVVKYFNSLEAWKIGPVGQGAMPGQQPPSAQASPNVAASPAPAVAATGAPATPAAGAAVDVTKMADDDDLPF